MNTLKLLLISLFVTALTACGGDDNGSASATAESASATANSSMAGMDAEAKAKAEEARKLAEKLAAERDAMENQ